MRGLLACLLPMAVAGPLHAQDGPETGTVVIQPENVRMDFAQVMRVKPVYQTLRATRRAALANRSLRRACRASSAR
jgi:hypothetical protein